MGKRQYGGLPKRCVYLRNTAGGGELPILQWINIDEVSLQTIIEYSSFELWEYEWKQEKLLQHDSTRVTICVAFSSSTRLS